MSDPYYLRKANIDDLDLSKYEKDYKPEELAAVKEALNAEKQKHEEQFNNLPFAQRAKYHAADVIDYAQQNPEAFLGIPAAAVLFGAGKVAAEKGSETAKKVHGSLRDFMSSKTADEGLLATQQAEKKVNPTVATPEQTIAPQPVQTAEKIIASAKPNLPVGVTAETEVGKAPKDMGLVERSEQNKLSKEVSAAAPKGSAPAPATPITGAINPEDRIPNYMTGKTKKGGAIEYKNKQGSDVIGKGGWNWYQSQMGPKAEEEWLRQFGRTNQEYKNVTQAVKEGRLQGAPVVEGKGGKFPRETTVPSYIKGNASLKGMASLAATAGLLGIAGSQKSQEAMERASKAIKDIGISPDIFAGKGEEIGRLGNAYVSAGNPSYQRELLQKIESTNDPEYKKLLQTELQKIGYSGGGRGIAPPSAYQR